MVRIFLELLASHYLDTTGGIAPLLAQAKQKNKPADWYPSLSKLMDAIMKDPAINLAPQARRALNRVLTNEKSMLSIEHMNQFVHNRHVWVTEKEVRNLWALLEPLLRQLLV